MNSDEGIQARTADQISESKETMQFDEFFLGCQMSEVFSRVEREMTWWICYPKASYVFRVRTDEGQLVVLVASRLCFVGVRTLC